MPESSTPNIKKGGFARVRKLMFIVTLLLSLFAILILLAAPFMPLAANQYDVIQNVPYELHPPLRTYTNDINMQEYALHSDGREMVEVITAFRYGWAWANKIRFSLKSPFYEKTTAGIICRYEYVRESLFEQFRELCINIVARDELKQAFIDGKRKLFEAAAQAKMKYERYKYFKLIE